MLNGYWSTLVFFLMLEARGLGRAGVDFEEGEVLGEEVDVLDEGVAEALGALDAAVLVELPAALLAEGMAAEDEQARSVGGVGELGGAIVAFHYSKKLLISSY